MQEEVENRTVNLAISTSKLTARTLINAFRAYQNHRAKVKSQKAFKEDARIVGEQSIDDLMKQNQGAKVKSQKAFKEDARIVGEQSIDDLMKQNQGATNIEIEKTDVHDFKKYLKRYGIDYAITKDSSQNPPHFLVFFKARDTDALTAAFKEYNASLVRKAERPSMLEQLAKFKAIVASLPHKVRQKKQEREL